MLVLDEPFEAVDPVSAGTIRDILERYVAGGATIIMSSHVMTMVESICDHIAVLAGGRVLTAGPLERVRGGRSLEEVFFDLVGGVRSTGQELTWLRSSSA